jgi:hypothetical protein
LKEEAELYNLDIDENGNLVPKKEEPKKDGDATTTDATTTDDTTKTDTATTATQRWLNQFMA